MPTLPVDFLMTLQARAARASLGPSSMRGRGHAGVVEAGRKALCKVDLSKFGTPRAATFRKALDRTTDELVQAFPRSARHWGLARKGLNIFLRECLYTVYLRDAHGLERAEAFFEVPLDSLSGRAIWLESGRIVPRWQTVRGLKVTTSDAYQAAASEIATHHEVARVHLDALWWGQRTDSGV